MKNRIGLLILCVAFLQACSLDSTESKMVEWGEYSQSQEKRLNENGIKFEVKNDFIYIDEKDVDKASNCCS